MIISHSLKNGLRCGGEADDEAVLSKINEIIGVEYNTASSGDDVSIGWSYLLDEDPFEISEIRFSMVFKNLRDGFFFGGFDEVIHIEKRQSELSCELFANGSFPVPIKPTRIILFIPMLPFGYKKTLPRSVLHMFFEGVLYAFGSNHGSNLLGIHMEQLLFSVAGVC